MPEMNVLSLIWLLAHQPALFLNQVGTFSAATDSDTSVGGIIIISSLIRYWIPWRNAESVIWDVAHHPAVFFTQSGTLSVNAFGIINPNTKSSKSETVTCFIITHITYPK